MRRAGLLIGVGVVVGTMGGCSLTQQEGGIASVVMEGSGEGFWVHEHMGNRALREGPYGTEGEAQRVAGGHNAVHHFGTRTAYVSSRRDGLGGWLPSERGWESPWGVLHKPREMP